MPLVAGVDSSTSACKVEVRDADSGEVVASGRAPHPPTFPPRSEQDPADWLDAFEQACQQAGVFGPSQPSAVSVAAQQHGLVVTDSGGRPLRPAKLWNDTESAPDSIELAAALPGGAAGWARACGSVPLPAFTITKLSWLRRSEPEVFGSVDRVMLPHDWLTSRLSGAFTTDRGDASGTGWWSPAEGRYRYDLLALVDRERAWDRALPEVLGPADAAGEWGGSGCVVAAGTGDNMAAALGLGLQPADRAFSLGTSGTAFCVSNEPATDGTGTVAGFADADGRYLPLVCTLNATKVTDAIGRLLGVSADELSCLARAEAPGARGLVLVPYFDGERTPDRPDATGILAGLRSDLTREQVARAAFEGVVCGLLSGADELETWSPRPEPGRIFLIGGGARSAAYRQVLADLTGETVLAVTEEELVARGAAIQAAAALRGIPIGRVVDDWGPVQGVTIDPTPGVDAEAIRSRYDAACKR